MVDKLCANILNVRICTGKWTPWTRERTDKRDRDARFLRKAFAGFHLRHRVVYSWDPVGRE